MSDTPLRVLTVAALYVSVTAVLHAQNYTTRLADARSQLARHNVDSAVTALSGIATDPRADSTVRAESFMWLGVAAFYQGNDSAARANLQDALRYDPLLLGAEPLYRLDSALAEWWEGEQTRALCGETLPAWGWPPKTHPAISAINAEARAAKAPAMTQRPPLEYPDDLRNRGIQGRVLARFILDASGRAERGSVQILSSPDQGFNRPVARMMERARFSAAVSGDTRVRSCVIIPVDFSVRR